MAKRTWSTVQKLTINKMYRKWEDYTVGDIVIGKLVGYHTDQYQKQCPIVEVLDCQFKKDASKYQGKSLVLNSCGMLNKNLEQANVQLGQIIQVEYKGTAEIEKGKFAGKDAHVLDIQLVEESSGEETVDL